MPQLGLAAIASRRRPDTHHPVEVLSQALRTSLRVGARPSGVVAYLDLFPESLSPLDEPYKRAGQIVSAISAAVYTLGHGPYGRAAQALFGLTVETRGRMLKDRRKVAADELDVAVSTFRRYYEAPLIAEVAFTLWQTCSTLADPEPQRDGTP